MIIVFVNFCLFIHQMLHFLIVYNKVHFVTAIYKALVQNYFCPFQNPFTLYVYTLPIYCPVGTNPKLIGARYII